MSKGFNMFKTMDNSKPLLWQQKVEHFGIRNYVIPKGEV